MNTPHEIYEKYLGHCLNQDPVRSAVIRAFSSLSRGDAHAKIFCGMIGDEAAREVLDEEDFELWVNAKAEMGTAAI